MEMTVFDALSWIQSTMVKIGPSIFYGLFALSIGTFILRLNKK